MLTTPLNRLYICEVITLPSSAFMHAFVSGCCNDALTPYMRSRTPYTPSRVSRSEPESSLFKRDIAPPSPLYIPKATRQSGARVTTWWHRLGVQRTCQEFFARHPLSLVIVCSFKKSEDVFLTCVPSIHTIPRSTAVDS